MILRVKCASQNITSSVLRISMFLETKSRETLRFEGNKIQLVSQKISDVAKQRFFSDTALEANYQFIDKQRV